MDVAQWPAVNSSKQQVVIVGARYGSVSCLMAVHQCRGPQVCEVARPGLLAGLACSREKKKDGSVDFKHQIMPVGSQELV